jgi:acyl-[acyl carrier protein]--UDP-N-acetylglucosamine O-acyltransferase
MTVTILRAVYLTAWRAHIAHNCVIVRSPALNDNCGLGGR